MVLVKIGCCGFARSRARYYNEFKVVELQNTFYDLPKRELVEKLRSEAPSDFEFTVKAWQVITHPSSSPTWKKMRSKPGGNLENYGYLKPTDENIKAFENILEIMYILNSKIVVLQTPASMPFNEESIVWVKKFFSEVKNISSREIIVGWEPRGRWAEETDTLKDILAEHNVLHVTDLFKRTPLHNPEGIVYSRLHGIGHGEVNYRYKYNVEDFEKLYKILSDLRFDTAYIMFNNIYMYDDAKRFREFLREKSGFTVL
ncbi:MAG: hypothetical protein B6U89_00220 [Desulfurococcales archaeon ex4484_58]|nr:MAG: hypothetical protein B6U89_00220 [Desulfurococcales archaeon ex4484_58]